MDDPSKQPANHAPAPDMARTRVASSYYKIVLLQILLTLCLVATLMIFSGGAAAVSALIGGGIAAAGSALYARLALVEISSAGNVLRAHLKAELAKIAAVGAMFALVLVYGDWVVLPWLFVAFLVASAGYWISLLVVK